MRFSFLLVATIATAYCLPVILSAAADCPESAVPGSPFTVTTACPLLNDCVTMYCNCVGGSMNVTSGECAGYIGAADATVQQCAARRVACTVTAAVAAGSLYDSRCTSATQMLRDAYQSWYYLPPMAQASSDLATTCQRDMCALLGASKPGAIVDVAVVCAFNASALPSPGLANSALAPYAPLRVFTTHLPSQRGRCGGVPSCETSMRLCLTPNAPVDLDYAVLPGAINGDVMTYEGCFKNFTQCLVSAATNITALSVAGQLDASTPSSCNGWAATVVQMYTAAYNASGDLSTSELGKSCLSSLYAAEALSSVAPVSPAASCQFELNGRPASLAMPFRAPTTSCNPVAANSSFTDPRPLPVVCPKLGTCEATLCSCLGRPLALTGECLSSYRSIKASLVVTCFPSYLLCVTNVASEFGLTMVSNGCNPWAYAMNTVFGSSYYSENPYIQPFRQRCASDACNTYASAQPDASKSVHGLMELAVSPSRAGDSVCEFLYQQPNTLLRPGRDASPPYLGVYQEPTCTLFPGQSYFYENLPSVVQCPALATCDATYCACVKRTVYRNTCSFSLNFATDSSVTHSCYPAYITCVTKVANALMVNISAGTLAQDHQSCTSWITSLSTDYRTFYNVSDNATKAGTTYYKSCSNLLCNTDYYYITGDIYNFTSDCLTAGINVGEPPALVQRTVIRGFENLVADARCPPSPAPLLASSVPIAACGASSRVGRCDADFCGCTGQPYNATTGCRADFSNVTSSALLESCTATYFRCLVSTSVAESPRDRPSGVDVCAMWKYNMAQSYYDYYFASNKSATSLVSGCASTICSAEMYAYGTVGANATGGVCGFDGLAAPPNSLSCGRAASGIFDNVPLSNCSSLAACVRTYCACSGGVFNGTSSECVISSAPPGASQCLSTGLACLVRAGLDLYVPGSDPLALPDRCTSWSVEVARLYQAYFNASVAARSATDLYLACNATVCKALSDKIDVSYGGLCAFDTSSSPMYVAPPPRYQCPDGSSALNIATCTCTSNAVIGRPSATFAKPLVEGTFTLSTALAAVGYATYSIADTSLNCSGFDFSPFLMYRWELRLAASGALVSLASGSSISVPASAMRPSQSYSLALLVTGLVPQSAPVVRNWTFTTVAPAPVVSIQRLGATLRVPNTAATKLTATVTDLFPLPNVIYSWRCSVFNSEEIVSSADAPVCPQLVNQSLLSAVFPAGADPGVFVIVYTYGGVRSSLTLTVVSGSVPSVRIIQTSEPVLSMPFVLYLSSQRLLLGSAVSYEGGNVTYAWSLANGTSLGSGKMLSLMASSLPTMPYSTIRGWFMNTNTLTLRVASAADSSVYGEATFEVVVASAIDLSLSVGKLGDAAATSATGLSDTLVLIPTTGLTTATSPYGLDFVLQFGYYTATALVGLKTTPTASPSGYSAQAPYVGTAGAVTFTVVLRVGGKDAATANSTFSLTPPSTLTAANSVITSAGSITDAQTAAGAAANIATLLNTLSNSDARRQLAVAAGSMVASVASGLGGLSKEGQQSVFNALSGAIASLDGSAKSLLQNQTLAALNSTVGSGSVDPSLASTLVPLFAQLDPQRTNQLVAKLATAVVNDPSLPVGQLKQVSSGGLTIGVQKFVGALDGQAMSSGGATLRFNAGFTLGDDVASDAVVGVSSTVFSSNPFAAGPTGDVVSYDVQVGGQAREVSNLQVPLVIVLAGTGSCAYWDTGLQQWSTAGLTTSIAIDGSLQCSTTHLTAFAGVPSAASGAVLPLAMLAVAFALQVLLL